LRHISNNKTTLFTLYEQKLAVQLKTFRALFFI
jgi:hypothetical protein